MKILHFIRRSAKTENMTNISRGVVQFYNKYFDNAEHYICYIKDYDGGSEIDANLTIPQTELRVSGKPYSFIDTMHITSMIKQYDYVVVHSMFLNLSTRLYLALNRKLCKKIVWIAWGYDLYRPESDKKDRVIDKLHTRLKNSIGSFIGIFPPDVDYFKMHFPGARAKMYYAPYSGAEVGKEYRVYSEEKRLLLSKSNHEPIYIQIGHNAFPSLNHIDVLNALYKWKDENIRILLVLSYGAAGSKNWKDYVNMVQKTYDEMFPGKVICLQEMIPANEYYELIQRVDIAIFNTYRQCGLGNIQAMIFKNVKLYMPEKGVMYPYFVGEGVPVQKYEDLENCSFEEFISPVEPEDPIRFGKFIDNLFNIDHRASLWNNIFEDLRKRLAE